MAKRWGLVLAVILAVVLAGAAGYGWVQRETKAPVADSNPKSQAELAGRTVEWQVESRLPGVEIAETQDTTAWFEQGMAALNYPPGKPVMTFGGSLANVQTTYPDIVRFVFVPLSQASAGNRGRLYETTESGGELVLGMNSTRQGRTAEFTIYLKDDLEADLAGWTETIEYLTLRALLAADPTNSEKRDRLDQVWTQLKEQGEGPWAVSLKQTRIWRPWLAYLKGFWDIQVQAQCMGNGIECGTWGSRCDCVGDNTVTCLHDGLGCGSGGTCDCYEVCAAGLDRTPCNAITSQTTCQSGSICAYCIFENLCYWYGGTGPTPTPSGGSCASSAPACNGSCPAPQNCISNGEGGCKCVPPPTVPDNLADIRVRVDTNTNGSIDDSDPYVYNSDSGFAGSCGYAATGADIQSIMAYQDQVDYNQDPDGRNQFDGYNKYCLPDSSGKPTSRFNSEGAFWYYITVPKGYKVVGGRSEEQKPGAQYQDNCYNDAVKKNIPEGGETWMIYCADMEAWENAEIEFLIQAECESFSDIYVKECNRNSNGTIKYYDDPRPEACKTATGTEPVTNLMSGMPKVRYREISSSDACGSADFSGISWESRTSTKNQTFSAGVGDKKICAEFTDRNQKVSVKCGGMIYRDVTPTEPPPTVQPPTELPILTPMPTPYVQGYLRNQAGGAVTAESFRRFCDTLHDNQRNYASEYRQETSSCKTVPGVAGVNTA